MTHAIPPSMLSCGFLSFWGKARPGEEEGPQYHPVWAHGLDVAAAGEALLQAFPHLIARAAEFLGWSVADFGATWVHLLALHDIGKFAPQFQNKVPALYPEALLGADREVLRSNDPGHPAAGLALLFGCFQNPMPLDRQRPGRPR